MFYTALRRNIIMSDILERKLTLEILPYLLKSDETLTVQEIAFITGYSESYIAEVERQAKIKVEKAFSEKGINSSNYGFLLA
jgi:hypothetical protein